MPGTGENDKEETLNMPFGKSCKHDDLDLHLDISRSTEMNLNV